MHESNSQNKKVIVIGSDSKIAENLIRNLSLKNYQLTTVSRNSNSNFGNFNHFCTDLSSIEELNILCKKIENQTFDIFIYFAGSFHPQEFIKQDYKEIINQINVNLNAAILLSQPVLKNMNTSGGGMMLYLGSSSSYAGFKNTAVYCSSKHGLLGFSRSIADEYREKGIRVACISPGSVRTKMSLPLHQNQNPETFIDPLEISHLIENLILHPPHSMWQEEIILKRLSYQ